MNRAEMRKLLMLPAAASPASELPAEVAAEVMRRSEQLRREHFRALWVQTDRLFAALFVLQWLAGIFIALWISPRTWAGLHSHMHPHVWFAVVLGAIIASGPITLAIVAPGKTGTRYVISISQMLFSALLIHLSGGRIESHFHIFGSLAFISFYRDWRTLVPATFVVVADHYLRGTFWPQSIFGVAYGSSTRWLEHAGWVVFEDIFLIWSCVRGATELSVIALRQAEMEATNQRVQAEVKRQTVQLESVGQELLSTARRAGMAEVATGVLHNVGNVLNSVNVSASVAIETLKGSEISSLVRAGDMLQKNQGDLANFLLADERGKHLPPFLIELATCIGQEKETLMTELQQLSVGLEHIKTIIGTQQKHAKNDNNFRQTFAPAELFEAAVAMEGGMMSDTDIAIERQFEAIQSTTLDKHKVLQILINFLSNARKSIHEANRQGGRGGRVVLGIRMVDTEKGARHSKRLRFEVADNGKGIAAENMTRIFAHGFTTSAEGHGFGLHSAANAAREMGGEVGVHSDGIGLGATFALDVPVDVQSEKEQLLTAAKAKGQSHAAH